jgi:hypothetical protein
MKKSIIMLAIFAAFFSIISINEMKAETADVTVVDCDLTDTSEVCLHIRGPVPDIIFGVPLPPIKSEYSGPIPNCPPGYSSYSDFYIYGNETIGTTGYGVKNGHIHFNPNSGTMYIYQITGEIIYSDYNSWFTATEQ